MLMALYQSIFLLKRPNAKLLTLVILRSLGRAQEAMRIADALSAGSLRIPDRGDDVGTIRRQSRDMNINVLV